MKKCNTCNAVYDDRYMECPTCGELLISMGRGFADMEQGRNTVQNNCNTADRLVVHGENAYRFMEQAGTFPVQPGALSRDGHILAG